MPMTDGFPLVYRFLHPPGRRGLRCRLMLSVPGARRPGAPAFSSGAESVTVEFADGQTLTAPRSAVVVAGSRPAHQAVKAARLARSRAEPPAT